MRVVTGLCLLLTAGALSAAEKKEIKKPLPPRPANGIRIPGVQIPFASLDSELTYDLEAPAPWIAATDSMWVPAKESLLRIDPKAKENKLGEPVAGLSKPCAGVANAFNSLWIPNCGSGAIVR